MESTLQHGAAILFVGIQATCAANYLAQENGAWRYGKRYAFPTSPHPRLRLRGNSLKGVKLTFQLVQKIGQLTITGAMGTYSVPVLTLYHSFSFFGRSANITAGLPYGVGNFSGNQAGQQKSIYRSGLLDFYARLSVNLIGGPAMQPKEFGEWKQKVILGASLKILAPTGQYDPTKLVNWGINRWAFKPEIGYSERWGNWILDAYGAVWFYTTNPDSFSIPYPAPQTEEPIGSFEGHLSYDLSREKTTKKLKPWVSLDGNFWWGGITSLSGIRNVKTEQTSSRIGGTFAWPLSRHQLLKFSYSDGTYIRFGGNYENVQVGWQYTWNGTHIR